MLQLVITQINKERNGRGTFLGLIFNIISLILLMDLIISDLQNFETF